MLCLLPAPTSLHCTTALQSFFETSNYESYKNNNPKRLPQTCQWFLQHPIFEKWRRSSRDEVLCLSADPGCGKSVLSRALIDVRLVTDSVEHVTLCYFFFNDNEEQSSATTALCALVHQLNCKHHDLLRTVTAHAASDGEGLRTDFEAMWNLFISAATSTGKVICVLDALDKCKPTERESLVKHLESFYTSRQASRQQERNLKFVTTSRPFTEDEPALF